MNCVYYTIHKVKSQGFLSNGIDFLYANRDYFNLSETELKKMPKFAAVS